MKFKIDENLPLELAEMLRGAHFDADTIFAEGLRGEADSRILDVCQGEGRVLVTLDLDFANIRAYPPDQYPGFIVLRPHRQDKPHVIDLFRQVVPLLESEPVDHRLWIVEESRVRIRTAVPPD